MFRKAQTKLTLYYSLLFLLLFWTFSSGLYLWMDVSFGEGYISKVEQRQGQQSDLITKNSKVVTIAGDVAMDQLRDTLIILNIGLLFVIPLISAFLARITLAPVSEGHEKQKQFVSDASHEMRTPLAIITGEIDVSLAKKRSAEEYRKILISTKEETKRLANLVENLLFLAKDDQQTNKLHLETVDITDLINEVKQALQTKSSKKHIAITLHTEETMDLPIVMGHKVLLRQLFYNLIDNAIIYTPSHGKISISLSDLRNSITVAITDTGVGIGKENLAKITRRFYRVDTSRSETKGYGLGLAIVQSIVARHHGKLLITSELKKGSTFTVILPKA